MGPDGKRYPLFLGTRVYDGYVKTIDPERVVFVTRATHPGAGPEGDEIEVDMATGVIHNVTQGTRYTVPKFPQALLDIIDAGGLMGYVKAQAM